MKLKIEIEIRQQQQLELSPENSVVYASSWLKSKVRWLWWVWGDNDDDDDYDAKVVAVSCVLHDMICWYVYRQAMKLVIAVKLSMCIPHLTSTKESFVTAKKEKKQTKRKHEQQNFVFL